MAVLVTGASGMLGTELWDLAAGSGLDLRFTDLRPVEGRVSSLDVRDEAAVKKVLDDLQPSQIVHMAAVTDLEDCERNSKNAWHTHVGSTQQLAAWARDHDSRLIYISTAGVFDGDGLAPYAEDDPPGPINCYGATKLAGELEVGGLGPRGLVVRTGWAFGGGPRDRKFVAKILRRLSDGARELHAVTDRLGSPTASSELARRLLVLLERRAHGIVHLASPDHASRYDVACQMLDFLGRSDVDVHPVGSDYFAREYFASRPVSETLRSQRLEELDIEPMPGWREMLKAYLGRSHPSGPVSGRL